MAGTQVFQNVPRTGQSGARKRCRDPRENWESQKTQGIKETEHHAKGTGTEFSEEAAQFSATQWNWGAKEPGEEASGLSNEEYWRQRMTRTAAIYGMTLEEYEERYSGKTPEPFEAHADAKIISAGGSSLSWTSADAPPDALEKERNANRQRAPVGWEADEGQSRGGVMSILGGRK